MNDLTGFQRDVLRGIATLGETKGLRVKAWLEEEADYHSVNHGRLYPNLDTLADKGLIRKGKMDDRTNSYVLTPRGEREVEIYAREWGYAVDALDGPNTARADGGERGLDALFEE